MNARSVFIAVGAALLAACIITGGCSGQARNSARIADSAQSLLLSEQLKQLEELQTPPGVDPELFQKLKDAFRAKLADGKMASSPPVGGDNAVSDLALVFDAGFYTATWSYRNVGDYNQDGEVGISDLTPLAMEFLQPVTPDNEWVDGNNDGAINIADVTPLAMHFLSKCDHYALMQSAAEAGPFTEVTTIPFANATGSQRKQFSAPSLDLSSGWFYNVQPFDSEGNPGEPGVTVRIPVNQPPEASFTADPPSGSAPLTVTFDANASIDPDGTIVSYAWDWESDGTVDETNAIPTATHQFTAGGIYQVGLIVTDNATAQDSAYATITAKEEWTHSWGQAGWDFATRVATNRDGEVFVTATLELSGTDTDIVLLKYSPQGDLLWEKAWGGAASDDPVGLAVNSYGEVFVIANTTSYGEGNTDVLLLKFSPAGDLHGALTWGSAGQEFATGLTLDGNENLIVSGQTTSFGAQMQDIFAIKFSGANADVEWAKLWGGAQDDFSMGVVAGGGSFYLSGTTYSYGEGWRDALLIAASTDGDLYWRNTWGTPLSEGARAIAMHPVEGTLYLTGFAEVSFPPSQDVMLLGFNQSGDLVLEKVWGGTQYDRGDAIAVFKNGDIAVGGNSQSFFDPLDGDAFLLRYSPIGALQWSRSLGGSGHQDIIAACLDNLGNLLLAGISPDASCVWSDVTGTETAPTAVVTHETADPFTSITGVVNNQPFAARNEPGVEDAGGGGDGDALALKLTL